MHVSIHQFFEKHAVHVFWVKNTLPNVFFWGGNVLGNVFFPSNFFFPELAP